MCTSTPNREWVDRLLIVGLIGFSLAVCLPAQAKTIYIDPTDGADQLVAAVDQAKDGDTIRIGPGEIMLSVGLILNEPGVTLEGAGKNRTLLNFASKPGGEDIPANTAISVSADRLVLQDFAVIDSTGPGIAGTGVNNITFKNLLIEKTYGHTSSGSMGVRLFDSRYVLFDGLTVRHATISGLQTTTSEHVIVRNSVFEENSVGLEVENNYFVDVHDNITRDNALGILILDMPSYPHTGGHAIRVFNNQITDNNRENKGGGFVKTTAPTGSGLLIMGGEYDIHVFDNRIANNGHANISLIALPWQIDNPDYNAVPNDVTIRNNSFGRSGFAPRHNLAGHAAAGGEIPDVVWDGATRYIAAGEIKESPPLRLTMHNNTRDDGNPVGFLSLNLAIANGGMIVAFPTDTMPEPARTTEPVPVQLPQDE